MARGRTWGAAKAKASPHSYAWAFWTDGKPLVEGFDTLAGDRPSFTEVSWRIDRQEGRVTLIPRSAGTTRCRPSFRKLSRRTSRTGPWADVSCR